MIEGVVAKINRKDWENSEGETLGLYSFKIDGDNNWYRTGTLDPKKFGAKEGVYISFDFGTKGSPNVNVKSIKVKEGVAPQRSPAPRASSSTKDDYWKQKEDKDTAKDARYQAVDIPRMTFCGAQDTAVQVVELALAQGALTLGTKKNGQLDILLGAVQEVAETLFRQRMASPELLTKTSSVSSTTSEEGDNTPEYNEDDE